MAEWFNSDQLPIEIPLLFGLGLLVLLGQGFIKKKVGEETIRDLHEVAGNYYAVVSTIYAVTLGLIVFDALGAYQDASHTVKDEAKSMVAIYSLAERFSPADRQGVQELVSQYVDAVIESEWSRMSSRDECPLARRLMFELIARVNQVNPENPVQLSLFPLMVEETIHAVDASRERLQQSSGGIPVVEWVVLIFGGLVTVLFSYFFTTHSKAQLLMSGMVAALIASNLYMVLAFGEPYKGPFRVSDSEFRMVRLHIQSVREN